MGDNKKMYRKKFLKLSGFGLVFGLMGSFAPAASGKNKKNIMYLKNSELPVIKKGYKGNLFVDGKFINEVRKPKLYFSTIMKWKMSKNPYREKKRNDTFRLNVVKNSNFSSMDRDMIVWLGHSCFYIRLDGKTYLTDPCLTKPPFVKRLSHLPCDFQDIKNIDYLLVSHSHMDHLDDESIKNLDLKNTRGLLPLRMGKVLKSFDKDIDVQEAGWYQKFDTGDNTPEVHLLPAQHWSQRSLGDVNEVLWGSYLLKGRKKTIYFPGDTAYAPHFKKIAGLFPSIDICLMPVGAYRPDYIMKGSHVSPWESLRAFHDLGGGEFIPMHYGTFDLSDEPYGEPVRVLKDLKSKDKIKGELKILDVGETYYL